MRHPIVRYGVALAVTVVAGTVRGVLGSWFPGVVPFAPFFPAVLVATLVGGLGPGLLATSLSALWAWFLWLQPEVEPASAAAVVTVNLALFVLICLLLMGVAEAVRRHHARSLAGERRFHAAEDLAVDAFGILEAVRDVGGGAVVDFRWTYANPAMLRTLRTTAADLIGRRLLDRLPGHRAHPVLFPSYVRAIATGEPEEAEVFYDADGVRGWFRVNVAKLNDGIAISFRNITLRREREDALRESEERFRLLADAVDDVFWILDLRQRKAVYVSPAYERVWGLSREALYRDPTSWRRHVHPEDRALADPAFDEMLRGRRQTFELVYRMQRQDGTLRWVRDKAWLVRAGEIERVVGVMTDITAEKASEEKQRLLARELDHRLKNSFALIQSIARMSARSARDLDEFIESLEARIRALAQAQDLVTTGSLRLANLDEIVRQTLAAHLGDGEETVDVGGPAIHVEAASVPLVHMAFHELATNSAKYGALSVLGGRVSVRWETEPDGSDGALRLVWRESGGPAVRPPSRRGFGSLLVERALAAEFDGEITVAFPPEGVTCTMRLPLSGRLTIGAAAA